MLSHVDVLKIEKKYDIYRHIFLFMKNPVLFQWRILCTTLHYYHCVT
jgi:hypothetical protein